MRRIKPPNIHLPPPLHFSHQWESVIDSKEKTMHVHSASPLYSESKQTGWSTCANSIPSFMTSDIRLYMQIYRVNNQGSGLKLHLMKRHRFACGLAWKQHTHTHTKFFLLSQYLVPFPGAPCGFVPVSLLPRLFWLQSQLASPPSFISSDPEQTNQIRWAKCPPRDSLCAYVLTDFRKVKHKENL